MLTNDADSEFWMETAGEASFGKQKVYCTVQCTVYDIKK
jgi:hypothetical protein